MISPALHRVFKTATYAGGPVRNLVGLPWKAADGDDIPVGHRWALYGAYFSTCWPVKFGIGNDTAVRDAMIADLWVSPCTPVTLTPVNANVSGGTLVLPILKRPWGASQSANDDVYVDVDLYVQGVASPFDTPVNISCSLVLGAVSAEEYARMGMDPT